LRYLCLLVGEPDMEGPVPGTPEFTQTLSDYGSATQAMADAGVQVGSAARTDSLHRLAGHDSGC